MEVSALIAPTLLVGVLLALLLRWRLTAGTHQQPPSPRGLPVIGHLHLLGALPHHSLCELSKIHGPLMSLRLGSLPIVVASSPAMARQILKEHDQDFAHRRPTVVGWRIFGGPQSMVFSSALDAHWKLLRRISATELFTARQLDRFRPVREAAARSLIRSVRAAIEEEAGLCCLRPKLLQALSDIVTEMMTGKTLTELGGSEDGRRVLSLIEEVPKLLGAFNVGDYLPFLAWMDLQGYGQRSKEVAAGLTEAFDRIFAERHRQRPASDGDDAHFLDVLLAQASDSSTPMSIMGNFLELFIGGTDTCAVTIEWAIVHLITNPKKLQLAQEELDEVVGRERMVNEDDIGNLPYVVACMKETMRLHPVVPLLMPHATNQECQVLDYKIPPKTQAYVNVWAIGRDPLVWEHPLEFMPERFLKDDPIDIQGQHFELLPFGTGRRICPGMRLALWSLNLLLACLLQGFHWNLSPSHKLDMEEYFGAITCKKTPLVALASPRLPETFFM